MTSVLTTHLLFTFFLFFFNDTATTEIYTLSLHDALPIFLSVVVSFALFGRQFCRHDLTAAIERSRDDVCPFFEAETDERLHQDRKSTRLNSSHVRISYAVFCLKKKNKHRMSDYRRYMHTH